MLAAIFGSLRPRRETGAMRWQFRISRFFVQRLVELRHPLHDAVAAASCDASPSSYSFSAVAARVLGAVTRLVGKLHRGVNTLAVDWSMNTRPMLAVMCVLAVVPRKPLLADRVQQAPPRCRAR